MSFYCTRAKWNVGNECQHTRKRCLIGTYVERVNSEAAGAEGTRKTNCSEWNGERARDGRRLELAAAVYACYNQSGDTDGTDL